MHIRPHICIFIHIFRHTKKENIIFEQKCLSVNANMQTPKQHMLTVKHSNTNWTLAFQIVHTSLSQVVTLDLWASKFNKFQRLDEIDLFS